MFDGVPRRHHQDRDRVALPARLLEELQPVTVRQSKVENDGIVGIGGQRGACVGDELRAGGLLGLGRQTAAGEPEPSRPDTVVLMAAELGRLSDTASERGEAAAALQSSWAWWSLAFIVIPAAVLLGLVLAR